MRLGPHRRHPRRTQARAQAHHRRAVAGARVSGVRGVRGACGAHWDGGAGYDAVSYRLSAQKHCRQNCLFPLDWMKALLLPGLLLPGLLPPPRVPQ